MHRRPYALVIAAPSGAGKTSLSRALVNDDPGLEFSVSATTRAPRGGERDGRDYFFVPDAEFDRMIAARELLEWAEVHGHRYGTPRRSLEEPMTRGKVVVLDIDVQGARQVRQARADAVLVFVLPPSVKELQRRLTGRASETHAQRHARLINAERELEAAREFDYIVVNDEFDRALATLHALVAAERTRTARISNLSQHIDDMRAQLENLSHEE